MLDPERLHQAVKVHRAIVRVVIADAKGSVPRKPGTAMLVWKNGQSGTIGGGALEYECARMARDMLLGSTVRHLVSIPLGPSMGQCCGGAVTVLLEQFLPDTLPSVAPGTDIWARAVSKDAPPSPPKAHQTDAVLAQGWFIEHVAPKPHPIVIYGAGHVGRALAPVLSKLPNTLVQVFDPRPDQAAMLDPSLSCITSLQWDAAATSAPPNATHFIMTPDHDADFALCHILLNRRDAQMIGLIGSATKWARFRKRLSALGHDPTTIARITCPIGDPALGKHPQAIAIGVAARLLSEQATHKVLETGSVAQIGV